MTDEIPESLRAFGVPKEVLAPNPKNWGVILGLGIFLAVAGLAIAILGVLLAPAEQRSFVLIVGGGMLLAGAVLVVVAMILRTNRVFVFDDGFGCKVLGHARPWRWDEIESGRRVDMRGSTHLFLRAKDGRKLMIQAAEFRGGDGLIRLIESEVRGRRGAEIRRAIDGGEAVDFDKVRVTREGIGPKPTVMSGGKVLLWSEVARASIWMNPSNGGTILSIHRPDGSRAQDYAAAEIPNVPILLDEISHRAEAS